jgi:hypothetical protein
MIKKWCGARKSRLTLVMTDAWSGRARLSGRVPSLTPARGVPFEPPLTARSKNTYTFYTYLLYV